MKKSKFTENQILETLQEAESGVPVAEVCRERAISVATFCQWRRRYAGMTVPELKGVKGLEAENARFKTCMWAWRGSTLPSKTCCLESGRCRP